MLLEEIRQHPVPACRVCKSFLGGSASITSWPVISLKVLFASKGVKVLVLPLVTLPAGNFGGTKTPAPVMDL